MKRKERFVKFDVEQNNKIFKKQGEQTSKFLKKKTNQQEIFQKQETKYCQKVGNLRKRLFKKKNNWRISIIVKL